MLKEKLLALGCVIGILACGACFGPTHYTPPPPPPITVEGIKRVRVVVTNQPDAPHLDTAALVQAITNQFNGTSNYSGATAYSGDKATGDEDGLLEVKILSEKATLAPAANSNGSSQWMVEIRFSESLTGRNGQTVWLLKEFTLRLSPRSDSPDEDSMWKDPEVQSLMLRSLATSVTALATHQKFGSSPTAKDGTSGPQ